MDRGKALKLFEAVDAFSGKPGSNLLLVRQHLADTLTEKVKYDQVIAKLMVSSNIEIRESVKSLMTSTKASFMFVPSKDHQRLDIVKRPMSKG